MIPSAPLLLRDGVLRKCLALATAPPFIDFCSQRHPKVAFTARSFRQLESSTSVPTTQIAEIRDFNCHGPAQTPPLNFRSKRDLQKPQKPLLLSGTRALAGLDEDPEGKFW